MKNNGKIDIAYNMQSAVDNKHRLIVVLDVVNEITDQSQLFPMTTLINNIISPSTERVILADTGYYNTEQIKKCIDDGNSLYLKSQRAESANGNIAYSKDQFQYQKETDTYLCPKGRELPFTESTSKNGLKYKKYIGGEICLSCPESGICTKVQKGRCIQRWEHEEILDILKEKTEENNGIYKKRSQIVEHPFGTIKRTFGYDYFLERGLESVDAEAALICVAYNFKRLTNIEKVSEKVRLLAS